MYGKKVKLRAFFILLIFVSLSLTAFLVFKSFEENVVYFMSPTEIKNSPELETKKIRVGGMVKKKSIKITDSEINFIITDLKNEGWTHTQKMLGAEPCIEDRPDGMYYEPIRRQSRHVRHEGPKQHIHKRVVVFG